MTKTLYRKFDKQGIATLPRVVFSGRIYVINSESEAEKAVSFLRTQNRVGVDTETRPSFKRGSTYQVALLQVSTSDVCFLFRLCEMGLPTCIISLLEDDNVTKIGLSLTDDWCVLRRRVRFEPRNYIDLQSIAPQLGIADTSLQKLYANLCGGMISKRQQLSNWQADVLSEAQQLYAATDAWVCIVLYDEMQHLLTTKDYQLITNDDTQPTNISASR